MADNAKAVLVLAAVLGLLIFGVYMEFATWHECRRVHPWWYCASSGDR